MVDALILDMDGVVRHWDPEHFSSTVRSFGVSREQFVAVAFEDALFASAMTGAISAEQWDDEIGRRLGDRHGCDPVAVAGAFAAMRWSIDDDVVTVVKEVRDAGRVRVALFSNASTRLEADLESCGLGNSFDVVFNSARLGVAKPDPEAFLMVAAALGTTPERCLFVDDTRANVEGARAAGMQAEAFTNVAALRSLLERAGLL
ncbi:MAG TPA: HAD family phosphatase [Acidimicrobiales bacterium]|jgi:putative hydrolase of the HAD superfamily|nr:HAD family phosphatase [Acidimicrobiales bacterium]